jgi:hypothetical protein
MTMTPCRCPVSRVVRSGLAGLLAVSLAAAASARAEVVTLPTDLLLGDRYYLAFVTSGTISGTSANVADYNAFVQAQANANGLGTIFGRAVTWKALVSTTSVNAITNLGIGNFPIYRLDDVKLATGSTDLWDGTLAVPLSVDQFGTVLPSGAVWTGSQTNGTPYPGYELGTGTPIFGGLGSAGNPWLVSGAGASSNTYRIYAFSGEMIAVPEPSSISIAVTGVALTAWTLGRRRPRRAGTQRQADPGHGSGGSS